MTIEKTIKALKQMTVSCSPTQIEELDYAISILQKLEKDGITDPLNTDFSKLQ